MSETELLGCGCAHCASERVQAEMDLALFGSSVLFTERNGHCYAIAPQDRGDLRLVPRRRGHPTFEISLENWRESIAASHVQVTDAADLEAEHDLDASFPVEAAGEALD